MGAPITAAPVVDPLLSMQVGDFVIQERIGAGGMGVVYRAVHRLIGKQAAIKVLRAELVSQQQVERLLIEARAVNAIHHPGIIDIFGFGSLSDGRPYIIMELLRGFALSAFIRQQGRLDAGTTVDLLDELLSALGAAHDAGVVHRDLKPGNVFMAENAHGTHSLKLVDFGIAKLERSQDAPTTLEGTILGTPEFMAPEQIRGASISPATDLYAVGVIAFQMLTGQRPFTGDPVQVLFAQVEQQPPVPSSRASGIPPELDALVLQLLAKDPAARPPSAEAVRQALRSVPRRQLSPASVRPQVPALEDGGSEGATWTLKAPPEARPAGARPALRWLGGLSLLAGLGLGGFLLWPAAGTETPVLSQAVPAKSEAVNVAELAAAPAAAVVSQDAEAEPDGAESPPAEAPSSPVVRPEAREAQPLEASPAAEQATASLSVPGPRARKNTSPVPAGALALRQAVVPEQLRRLANMDAAYAAWQKSHPPDWALVGELRRLNDFGRNLAQAESVAVEDLNHFQSALDALQRNLDARLAVQPTVVAAAASSKREVEPVPVAATAAVSSRGSMTYKLNQLSQLDAYDRKLMELERNHAGDASARKELSQLRELAEQMETDGQRKEFQERFRSWKKKYLPVMNESPAQAP